MHSQEIYGIEKSLVEFFVIDEDKQHIFELERRFNRENFKVTSASSLLQAYEKLKRMYIDLNKKLIFIVEYCFHCECNGVHFIEEIRNKMWRLNALFFILTNGNDPGIHEYLYDDWSKIRASGKVNFHYVDDIFFKDIEFNEMLNKIGEYL